MIGTSAGRAVLAAGMICLLAATAAAEQPLVFSHSSDYTRVSGRLAWRDLEGGFWDLMFMAPKNDDPHKGHFVLGKPKLLAGFKDGDMVDVTGKISADQMSIYQAGTMYDVATIKLQGAPLSTQPDSPWLLVDGERADYQKMPGEEAQFTGKLWGKEVIPESGSPARAVPEPVVPGKVVPKTGTSGKIVPKADGPARPQPPVAEAEANPPVAGPGKPAAGPNVNPGAAPPTIEPAPAPVPGADVKPGAAPGTFYRLALLIDGDKRALLIGDQGRLVPLIGMDVQIKGKQLPTMAAAPSPIRVGWVRALPAKPPSSSQPEKP